MLELKNLVFEVPADDGGTKRIIDDLSLTIPDDRFTVITGPNGGGKSTLAKLIMGIEEPTSGQILFDEPEAGIDLWSFDRLTETFRDIHEARDGRSIVIISHQERIISLADEIVLLRDGQVAEVGTPAELMPRLGFAARSLDDHGCPLSTPTELHLTEIPTTC